MTEQTVAEIDAQIKILQAKKKALEPKKIRKQRAKKEQKQVRHQRLVVCSYCGKPDKKTNMERISKYEYQHPICMYQEKKQVRIEFAFGQ